MSIERHPKIPDLWKIRYYPEGRKKDPKTGKPSNKKRPTIWFEGTESAAHDYYAQLLRTSRKVEKLIAPTISQAWPEFCQYYKNNVSATTYTDYLNTWRRHLEPFFGSYRPGQIMPALIENYKEMRLNAKYLPGRAGQLPDEDKGNEAEKRRPVKKRTITKELSYLSSMLTWMARPEINMANQMTFKVKGWSKKHTEADLPRVPTRKEVILTLRKSSREYRRIFATIYYAGLRKTEGLKISAKDIHMEQGYMIVKGKGDKQRIVPIFRKLKVYIRRKTNDYLFVNPETNLPYVDIVKPLRKAAKKAGADEAMHLHLLRHAFGVHCIMSGISPRSLQLMLGHSSITTTEIYTRLANMFLAQEMDKFGGGALRGKRKK